MFTWHIEWERMNPGAHLKDIAIIQVELRGACSEAEMEWRRKKEMRFTFKVLPVVPSGPSTISTPTRCSTNA